MPTSGGVGHKHRESFLREMQIRSDRLRDRPGAHCIHGNAVGEAVTLVTPGLVERQALEERLPRLWDHFDVGVSEDIARSDLPGGAHAAPGLSRGASPGVPFAENGDPVSGIHEYSFHRFGTP